MMTAFVLACALAATPAAGIHSTRAKPRQYDWKLPKGFPQPRIPAGNPMSEDKVRLDRYLFYDKRMSVNRTQSCATCHQQELAFTNGDAVSLGATGQPHPRRAMSLVNVAYSAALTWNNPNVRSLEEQALIPLLSDHPVELGLRGREDALIALVRDDPVYRELFPRSFPETNSAFTVGNITKALAAFERTIISASSPYDRYYLGGDRNAISDSAKRGELLFFNDPVAGCFRCHGGFNFTDVTVSEAGDNLPSPFHNTGLYNLPGTFSYPWPNLGIYEHTKKSEDIGKFKAPSLRNVALRAPYMHDGSVATLDKVLDHYEAGGRTIAGGPYAGRGHDNPNKDRRVAGIALTPQNRIDLLTFLNSLTDEEVIRDSRFSNPW